MDDDRKADSSRRVRGQFEASSRPDCQRNETGSRIATEERQDNTHPTRHAAKQSRWGNERGAYATVRPSVRHTAVRPSAPPGQISLEAVLCLQTCFCSPAFGQGIPRVPPHKTFQV